MNICAGCSEPIADDQRFCSAECAEARGRAAMWRQDEKRRKDWVKGRARSRRKAG
jgi:predicted nucleic acid-binding Zn ribbon protein